VLILPLMNKLSATHADAATAYQPLTAAHGEEFEVP